MHNCKATVKQLIELAVARTPSAQNESLLAELELCSACREEFASLRSVLRVTDQAIESAQPPNNFWSGYHTRLRQSLETGLVFHGSAVVLPTESGRLIRWRRFFMTSIRIPVPVAAVLMVTFGLSIVFAVHSRRASVAEPQTITRTIEIPVTTERTVTRVVYRDRVRRGIPARIAPPDQNRIAAYARQKQNGKTGSAPFSLAGFKPTSDANLTIIKGGFRDEK